ncbi:hypothetical protein Drorol1_Dr00011811 [Drosera rotundifolia]
MDIEREELPFDVDFHSAYSLSRRRPHLRRPPPVNHHPFSIISSYRFAADSTPQRWLGVRPHEQSCRALRFINEGRAIVTGSPDCSITASDVRTVFLCFPIKVLDTRQRSCCNKFNAHVEYISDMTFASDPMKFIATSGDGTLSVCNLRRDKVQSHSEFSEDELLSVVLTKNDGDGASYWLQ